MTLTKATLWKDLSLTNINALKNGGLIYFGTDSQSGPLPWSCFTQVIRAGKATKLVQWLKQKNIDKIGSIFELAWN